MPECPSCHREVSETARFCPFCGAELPGAAAETSGAEKQAPVGAVPPPIPPGTAAATAPTTLPQPPAKTKTPHGKRTGMVLGIVIAVIGLLVLGAVIGLGIATGVHFVRGPLDATNTYIRALNNGDAATAYDLLASDAPQKRTRTLEEFTTDVVDPAFNRLRSWRTGEIDFPHGTSRATVTVTESLRTGEVQDWRFVLREVGSTWFITDYYIL